MRGKQQTPSENDESAFAMTILPGKRNRKGKSAGQQPEVPQFFTPPATPLTPAQFAPPAPAAAAVPGPALATVPHTADSYPATYPAAPGFPPQPVYPEASTGEPGYGRPGVPPAGYTPINFLDDHDHDRPEHARPKSRTPLLLAAALVVALAAGGYYEAPKLLHSKKSSASTTTLLPKPAARASSSAGSAVKSGGAFALPATIGTLAKQPDTATTAAALVSVRESDPALANVQAGFYGSGPSILVVGGALPASVVANTAAQQVALIKRIDAALPTDTGIARNLAAAPQAAGTGEFWCGLEPTTADSPASTDCIAVDSRAVILVSVVGPDEAANVQRAATVRGLVEHP